LEKKTVIIIGAGLVGSLLSIYLSKRGYEVKVYERRHDMRKEAMVAGRSINLALSDRGINALSQVGIMQEIEKIAIPMHGRYIHKADGTEAYQPYGKEGQFINSVSRGELNCKLMDMAEENDVEIFFNQRCAYIDWSKNMVIFSADDGAENEVTADLIFASDGAYSAGRLNHMLQHDRFEYKQSYIDFGYKELTIPADKNGDFVIEKNALHIWPRGNYMLIALPNMDGSFTCTLFFPFEGDPSFASLDSLEKVEDFFKTTFPDAYDLMPTLSHDFFHNPTAALVTVKCFPWIRDDKFSLIGDAAHAIVPFFGQGMNAGFEDCVVLNELIEKHDDNWKIILSEFQKQRKPDADAIADLALNNFVEMRDKVGDSRFLLQKKIEQNFSAKHPDKWIPLYSQVTFNPGIRYSDALESGNKQEQVMKEVMAISNIEELWDSRHVENLMLQRISNLNQTSLR
jgi:kynurenine 3-monooxygenase